MVDNLTPGRMAEWGLSYKELKEINAGIIQLHVSGYGSWGPWTGRTPYDVITQSMGGLSAITGFEDRGPIKSGVWIANWITGLMSAIAILTALNYRERTGQGQFIDYLQAEYVIRWLDWTWLYAYKTGEDRKRSGNRDLAICPSDLFDCKDGWVAIAAFRVKEYEDSMYGHMVQHCYPPRLSETPSRLKWSCRPLGFDNAYVLTKTLDLSSEEVQELEQEGVVFKGQRTIPSRKRFRFEGACDLDSYSFVG